MEYRLQQWVPAMSDTGVELVGAQRAHRLFRGSAELSKLGRGGAVALEISAAALAYLSLSQGGFMHVSEPLVALLLLAVAALLRFWADACRGFALRCRRASANAYAIQADVDVRTGSDLEADKPRAATWVAQKLFGDATLEDYYDAKCSPGRDRLREIYAHSAHFTWQLLRRASVAATVLSGFGVALTLVGLYTIGAVASPGEEALSWLDVICGLVMGAVLLRVIVAAVRFGAGARSTRRIYNRLVDSVSDPAIRVVDLTIEYDLARASGPSVPTWAYRLAGPELVSSWANARQSLLVAPEETTS